MFTPTSRGQRGGSATRGGGRATPFQPTRGRGSFRGGSATPTTTPRGRGRGRGAPANTSPSVGGDGLLQKLRAGTVNRGAEDATTTPGGGTRVPKLTARPMVARQAHHAKKYQAGRGATAGNRGAFTPNNARARGGRGRGRGFVSQNFIEAKAPSSTTTPSRTSSPAPNNQRDFMNAAIDRFTVVCLLLPRRLADQWRNFLDHTGIFFSSDTRVFSFHI